MRTRGRPLAVPPAALLPGVLMRPSSLTGVGPVSWATGGHPSGRCWVPRGSGGPRLRVGRRDVHRGARAVAPTEVARHRGGTGDGGWGNRQPAGLWSREVSVRVRVPQPVRAAARPPAVCRVVRTARPARSPVSSQQTPSTVGAVVVLAAGQGTRMRSGTPKVLHRIGGRTMLGHVLAAAAPLGAGRTVV